jgi:uncharacterized membrane protein (GlpM family)
MDCLYTLLKFIIGGSVIVGVTLLAEHVDPRYGGMLAAAPIITTLAFLFTYSEAGRETTHQLVISAFYFAIPSLIFLLVFYFLMERFSLLLSLKRGIRDLDRGSARGEPDCYGWVILNTRCITTNNGRIISSDFRSFVTCSYPHSTCN